MEFRKIGLVLTERKIAEDDNWGQVISTIQLDDDLPETAFDGLEDFSHLQIIYRFHLVEAPGFCGKRHPRGNTNWPEVGTFGQRNKNRINRIGVCNCTLIKRINPRQLQVRGLDAIDQTPILDIKPIFKEFLIDKKDVIQPQWVTELMENYWN